MHAQKKIYATCKHTRMSSNMYNLSAAEGNDVRVAPVARDELVASIDQVHAKSYSAENEQGMGAASRENYEVQGGDWFMFNANAHTTIDCGTVSNQGGRTSGPRYSNGSAQCPSPVSIPGMVQSPSPQDLIAWDTESRQSRAKFVERDLFVQAIPNDGTFGTRLEGSGSANNELMVGCAQMPTTANPRSSFCGLGGFLELAAKPDIPDFFSASLVSPAGRAVSVGNSFNPGCYLNDTSGGNTALCAFS